ncbi:MAG: septum formation protein Maf, partial [Deltaproteobacteria bacterium]|nr:septum formation protein Maf [Deltaproteobacteria bacterium]
MPPSFILASRSPRRREMLIAAGFDFEVAWPIEEANHAFTGLSPAELVLAQARAKAASVALTHPQATVLAADTVVAIEGRILGKPADASQAEAMLASLSGAVHEVLTGFCLVQGRKELAAEVVQTEVEFRRLIPAEIKAYVAAGSPLDKAGAYGIQDLGGGLVRRISGSYTNVVGLPLAEVIEVLARV